MFFGEGIAQWLYLLMYLNTKTGLLLLLQLILLLNINNNKYLTIKWTKMKIKNKLI